MRDQLIALAVTSLPLLAAYVAALVRRLVAQRLYAAHVEQIRVRARAVVADEQRDVDTLKDPARPGAWGDVEAVRARSAAVARVRRLEPLACRVVLDALDGDRAALDDLVGTHVEEAVREMRRASTAPSETP